MAIQDTDTLLKAAVYVEKGGVGKTTSASHLAVAAAQDHDLDVLLIDLAGTQNDLAAAFGLLEDTSDPEAKLSAIFGDNWEFIRQNVDNIVDRMTFETEEGVDLIPSDQGLSGADNNLSSVPLENRYSILSDFLSDQIAPHYDLVLMDLPGGENNIALNGLFAAEQTVVPLKPGEFEANQLENLQSDLKTIEEDFDGRVTPRVSMIIPTMIDRRTNQSAAFVDELEAQWPDRVSKPVSRSQDISDLQGEGQTLFAPADDELYDTGKRAREAYRAATDQLLKTLQ